MSDESKLEMAIAGWDVAGAPPGFADRVLSAASSTPSARPRRGVRLAAAVLGIAAAVVLALWLRSPLQASGTVDARQTTTAEIPQAIVVAHPNALVHWVAKDDAVEVEQLRGRVFYRVQRESTFTVTTPLGRVDVTGTSFEVEVHPMPIRSKNTKAAAAAAALASAVTVSLYEGRVVIAGGGGTETLEPGQTATMRADAPPEISERTSLASLREENERLRDDLDAQRRLLRTRRASPTDEAAPPMADADDRDVDASERVHTCAMTINGDLGCPMVDPSQEILERRADCGVVVYDRPRALESPNVDFTELAELAGLSDRELDEVERATRSFHEHMRSELAEIYRELGGAPELAAKLSTAALASEIEGIADDPDVYTRVSASYAAVLAGRESPTDLGELPPLERHAFIWTASGDLYESWLSEAIGESRAAELRQANDGWLGNRGMQGTPRCPDAP